MVVRGRRPSDDKGGSARGVSPLAQWGAGALFAAVPSLQLNLVRQVSGHGLASLKLGYQLP